MEFLSLLPRASDPWGAGADLAEAASDGKSLLLDNSLVQGRGVRQGACCELLMFLVSIRDSRQWALARP